MNTSYDWINKDNKKLKFIDISDDYLLNILGFVCKGGGYTWFLSDERIINLFQEASKRELKHNYNIKTAIMAINDKILIESMDCW